MKNNSKKNKTLKQIYAFSILIATIIFAACAASKQTRIFGTEPNLKETTSIAHLTAQPADFVDKEVLVSGKVIDICKHRGCWVEIEQADHTKILCKSIEEDVTFPPETLGKEIILQGTLMYDPNAPGAVQKSENGEAPHACPAPQVMVSIKGAKVIGLKS